MNRSFQKATVLVTGGTGFLGRHLTEALIARGARVHVLARSRDSFPTASHARVTVHAVDIASQPRVRVLLRRIRPHYVFNLAANVRRNRDHSIRDMMKVNFFGLLNLLEETSPGLRRFLQVGSADEYGLSSSPFRESARENPVSPYGLSKACATQLCGFFYRQRGCPVTVVRPFVVYGPGQTDDMFIPSIIRSCVDKRPFRMTAGRQTRDVVYVTDAVAALLAAALSTKAIGRVLNVGSGREHSIRDIAIRVARLTGARRWLRIGSLPPRASDTPRVRADLSEIRAATGWSPRVSLETGLRETIRWYKETRRRR